MNGIRSAYFKRRGVSNRIHLKKYGSHENENDAAYGLEVGSKPAKERITGHKRRAQFSLLTYRNVEYTEYIQLK